jgi:hypothetical protein
LPVSTTELCDDTRFEAEAFSQRDLGAQRRVERRGGNLRVALGVAGKRDPADTVPLDDAARQKREAVAEWPDRRVGVAADQQDRPHLGLACRAVEKIACLREAQEAPRCVSLHSNCGSVATA